MNLIIMIINLKLGASLVAKPSFLFPHHHEHGVTNPIGYLYAMVASLFAAAAFLSIRMLGTTAKLPWPNVILGQGLGASMLSIPTAYIFGQTFIYSKS